jgi:hypothetical protein
MFPPPFSAADYYPYRVLDRQALNPSCFFVAGFLQES